MTRISQETSIPGHYLTKIINFGVYPPVSERSAICIQGFEDKCDFSSVGEGFRALGSGFDLVFEG